MSEKTISARDALKHIRGEIEAVVGPCVYFKVAEWDGDLDFQAHLDLPTYIDARLAEPDELAKAAAIIREFMEHRAYEDYNANAWFATEGAAEAWLEKNA